MLDQKAANYLATLPEVETVRLPKGTIFWANKRIYEVIEAEPRGFHKAREWRQTEVTDVALVPNSFPSRYLPLVRTGYVLPVYRSRMDLADGDQPACFVFPTETLALDAAYLDLALVQSSGAYVRKQDEAPAFAITNGVRNFRLYYFRETTNGRRTDLSPLQHRPLPFQPKPHTAGPDYWRLLPSWTERVNSHDVTQQIDVRDFLGKDDTHPHIPLVPDQD